MHPAFPPRQAAVEPRHEPVQFANHARLSTPGGPGARDCFLSPPLLGVVPFSVTLLLKATYEERIFHTAMQRDQWFQLLIGSKRRELGLLPDKVDQEVPQDDIEDDGAGGALTDNENARVMLDLRPERPEN
jgi:hypothetical protein